MNLTKIPSKVNLQKVKGAFMLTKIRTKKVHPSLRSPSDNPSQREGLFVNSTKYFILDFLHKVVIHDATAGELEIKFFSKHPFNKIICYIVPDRTRDY